MANSAFLKEKAIMFFKSSKGCTNVLYAQKYQGSYFKLNYNI